RLAATARAFTLPLHDALPISTHRGVPRRDRGPARTTAADESQRPADRYRRARARVRARDRVERARREARCADVRRAAESKGSGRSEEHTSELQSRENLVCRLL